MQIIEDLYFSVGERKREKERERGREKERPFIEIVESLELLQSGCEKRFSDICLQGTGTRLSNESIQRKQQQQQQQR